MRKNKRFKTKLLKVILAVAVIVIFMTYHTQNIEAANIFSLEVNESYMANGEIFMDVKSYDDSTDLHIIFAFYNNEDLLNIDVLNINGFIGNQEIVKNYTENYTSVKVYFSNQSTLAPLCEALQINNITNTLFNVTFADYDNTTLDIQQVRACSGAVPIISPYRTGYIFVGWDKEYDFVTSDLTINAMYIEDDLPNIFTLSECQGQVGDQVMVTFKIQGTVNLCAFETKIEYDSDVLQFASYDSSVSNLDVVVNHIEENSMILLNSTSLENTTNETEILRITFLIKDTTLYESEVIFIDGTTTAAYTDGNYNLYPADYNCVNGKVIIR